MARVVVVGAGLAGLSAAARLARLKHDVVVCERASGPGGQAGRYERDGFAFDTGPTTLTMPASYRDLFVKTGKTTPLEKYLELEPIEPAVRWRFRDGTCIDLPNASLGGTADAIGAALGADSAKAWNEFVRCGEGVWTRFRQGFQAGPPVLSGRRFRVPAVERAVLDELNPARSYADLMDRHLAGRPHLALAAASWPLRMGSHPDWATAGMVLWPWLEQTFGVWVPEGGVRALVDVVAERAVSRGAVVRYGCEVVGLEHAAGTVAGVRLGDGEVLPADIVVSAADRSWSGDRGAASRSCSAFVVLVALRGVDDGPSLQLSFADPSSDLTHEADDLFHVRGRRAQPVEQATIAVGRALAPEGCTGYTVSLPALRHGSPDAEGQTEWSDEATDAHARAVLAELEARGFDVGSRLLWHVPRSPRDLAAQTGTVDGAIAGAALHGRTGLIRPPNATAVPGLFHVGAAAHPGPGIAFAPLGGALVAEALGRVR